MKEQFLALPPHLFNALVDYLSSKPYSEVHQFISAMQQSVVSVDLSTEESEEETSDDR